MKRLNLLLITIVILFSTISCSSNEIEYFYNPIEIKDEFMQYGYDDSICIIPYKSEYYFTNKKILLNDIYDFIGPGLFEKEEELKNAEMQKENLILITIKDAMFNLSNKTELNIYLFDINNNDSRTLLTIEVKNYTSSIILDDYIYILLENSFNSKKNQLIEFKISTGEFKNIDSSIFKSKLSEYNNKSFYDVKWDHDQKTYSISSIKNNINIQIDEEDINAMLQKDSSYNSLEKYTYKIDLKTYDSKIYCICYWNIYLEQQYYTYYNAYVIYEYKIDENCLKYKTFITAPERTFYKIKNTID